MFPLGDKSLSESLPQFSSYRDVLEIWVARRKSARGSHCLVVGGMNPPRLGVEEKREGIGIGRFELGQLPVLQGLLCYGKITG